MTSPIASSSSVPVLPSPTQTVEITETPTASPVPSLFMATVTPVVASPTSVEVLSGGYSGDTCRTDLDCAGTRECLKRISGVTVGPCDSTSSACFCMYESNGILNPERCPSGSTVRYRRPLPP